MPVSRPVRIAISLAVLVFASPPLTPQRKAPAAHPLAALAFMAGCWHGNAGTDKTTEEQRTGAAILT